MDINKQLMNINNSPQYLLPPDPSEYVAEKMSNLQQHQDFYYLVNELLKDDESDTPLPIKAKTKKFTNNVNEKLSALDTSMDSIHSHKDHKKPFQSPFHSKRRIPSYNFTKDKEEQIYDTIQVVKNSRFIEPIQQQEQHQAAKKLMQLMLNRDLYLFPEHQDYSNILDVTHYDSKTNEPQVDWSIHIPPKSILNEVQIQINKAELVLVEGVYSVQIDGIWLTTQIPSIIDFIKNLLVTVEIASDKVINSFCYNRNKFLEQKYKMHCLFNDDRETTDQKKIKHKDFYHILKVDTHVHHSQSMSGKHLLEFMKNKFSNNSDEYVYQEVGATKLTLRQISDRFKFSSDELNLDMLDVQADKQLYKRFDRFTSKYSPLGQPILRNIFLKSDNYNKGRYIAELTHEMFGMLDKSKYVACEYRITIYGKDMMEWHTKGRWLIKNKLQNPHVRWLIQIPRLYSVYREGHIIGCFQEMIDNIFRPLFDITINPTIDLDLYQALFAIVGFDTVDDETKYENFYLDTLKTTPINWTKKDNPHYSQWIYYIYANLYSLNALRKLRGLNTFDFRPHCGEAGSVDHLACAFLVAEGINHGLVLESSPVLKYLYYLKQIGIAMSPISNNKLVCKYGASPFTSFFQQGLNISLSTDDPLMLHMTDEPLIEEFAIAAQMFDLSNVDLAELARNSVQQSSFEHIIKEHFLGKNYQNLLQASNNHKKSNVPQSRFKYRQETLREEFQFLRDLTQKK